MQPNFLEKQLQFQRVHQAYQLYDTSLRSMFRNKELSFPPKNLYLRVFKKEQVVEVWASDQVQYTFIKSYSFTAISGKLGPKQREGDLQIPEGFYQLKTFNPISNYHLSFKVNYPNTADRIRNKDEVQIGGDIYIHGSNKTVGCIPLGDKNISELYWMCVAAYSVNSMIPIHIFPCKMNEKNAATLYAQFPDWQPFWKSLEPMYRFFESHKMLGEITGCDSLGNYQLAIPWD